MIGAIASRHINSRRRGSSPSINPQLFPLTGRRLSTQLEESDDEKKEKEKDSDHEEAAQSGTGSEGSDHKRAKKSSFSSVQRKQSQISVSDMPTRFRQRRRAVEISDQRACVLLHSRLKGMKLGDIA